jgi:hypothetical protein
LANALVKSAFLSSLLAYVGSNGLSPCLCNDAFST